MQLLLALHQPAAARPAEPNQQQPGREMGALRIAHAYDPIQRQALALVIYHCEARPQKLCRLLCSQRIGSVYQSELLRVAAFNGKRS